MREPLWNAEGILGRSEVKVFFFLGFRRGGSRGTSVWQW